MNKIMAIGAIFIGVILLLAIGTAVYAPPAEPEPSVSTGEDVQVVEPSEAGVDDLVIESEVSATLDESFDRDLQTLEAELQGL